MGTLQSFDRMTYAYVYHAEDGLKIHYTVKGGDVYLETASHNLSEEVVKDGADWAREQWHKARAAYLEEAQEQELADRIARSRGEE